MNIGVYHLQWCNLEDYIKAKAEILEGLDNRGKLIINADDENIKKIDFSRYKGEIIKIGLSKCSHYTAERISYTKDGMVFDLIHNDDTYPVYVHGYGRHNVYNAMAAIAATHTVGIPVDQAITSLASFKSIRQHLQFCKGINGSTIIDDTWNCNPPSIKAALEVLSDMAKGRKKIAVLGYMPRLGEAGKGEYLKAGERVVEAGVDCLVVIGEEAKDIGVAALKMGMDISHVYFCNTGDEVFDVLHSLLDENTLVLFKFPYKSRLKRIASFQQLMKKAIKIR